MSQALTWLPFGPVTQEVIDTDSPHYEKIRDAVRSGTTLAFVDTARAGVHVRIMTEESGGRLVERSWTLDQEYALRLVGQVASALRKSSRQG